MINDFVKRVLDKGGEIHPLIIPASQTNGLGLMNPSIINDNGVLRGVLRQVNYTLYHSEKKTFNHQYGPLQYIHPEDDLHLRTWNWYFELDHHLRITRYNKIDTSKFDTYEPQWDFVGLEDARIVRWKDDLWLTGVRRDTTPNGVGRMELSKIDVQYNYVTETERYRIEHPDNPEAYCEKNWMPFIDHPMHYMKWSNPAEVVKANPEEGTSEFIHRSSYKANITIDPRGGSQILKMGDYYVGITHDVDLFNSPLGRKDGVYSHRILLWDKNFNVIKFSDKFWFLGGHIEFCVGMCFYEESFLMTFGFQDNAAYVLKVPQDVFMSFLNE